MDSVETRKKDCRSGFFTIQSLKSKSFEGSGRMSVLSFCLANEYARESALLKIFVLNFLGSTFVL